MVGAIAKPICRGIVSQPVLLKLFLHSHVSLVWFDYHSKHHPIIGVANGHCSAALFQNYTTNVPPMMKPIADCLASRRTDFFFPSFGPMWGLMSELSWEIVLLKWSLNVLIIFQHIQGIE